MTRRRSRVDEARRRRTSRGEGPDPQAIMRFAGLGVMALVLVAVGAGFQGERVATLLARVGARLGPLAEPVMLGASALEIAGLALVLVIVAWAIWRGFRR